MTIEVIATPRVEQGTGASRRLRRAGSVPGIVYGGLKEPVAITLNHNDLYHAMQKEGFHASILTLKIDGATEPVLLRDANYHPWKAQILHVDFQRVDPNMRIHLKVPLHFINEDIAPGVKTGGGSVSRVATEVEISCLPAHLPEFIQVDMALLELGQSLHLADIKLAEGLELVALRHGDNATVASIIPPKGGNAD